MSKSLADVAVRPLVGGVAVIGGVGNGVRALGLSGTVLGVMEVKAVADVAEQARGRLLLRLWITLIKTCKKKKKKDVCFKQTCEWNLGKTVKVKGF